MLFLAKSSGNGIQNIQTSLNDRLLKSNINFVNDTFPTRSYDLVGGLPQKWRKNLTYLSQSRRTTLPQVGEIMEALKEQLRQIKIADVPLFLDPQKATFLDVAIHAKIRQYLHETTIEKHLRYARFMENHPCPINFRNLTPEMFLRHMDYRLYVEDPPATPIALKHEKRALLMFLRAFKQFNEDWREYIKTPPVEENDDAIFVPLPSVVNQLYHAQYSEDFYENILLQTIVFVGFNFGMRPPSELCNLNLDDVIIYEDGTGYIRFHEEKKHNKKRIYYPWDKVVLSSRIYRTPKNYIRTWRPLKETEDSSNALFLHPEGKRITGDYLRKKITPIFKAITKEPTAKLYTMRHTYGTYLYDQTKDVNLIAKRLGHKDLDNVHKYIHISNDIRKQTQNKRRNLFHQALRQHHFNVGGKPEKRDTGKKGVVVSEIPSEKLKWARPHAVMFLREKTETLVWFLAQSQKEIIGYFSFFFSFIAGVVQKVERPICNEMVVGSIPITGFYFSGSHYPISCEKVIENG